jgi:dual specificity tyrosine-phosphorylation-regulated kinase 2/3/4
MTFKLIDFGSAFKFTQVNNRIQVTTPEYLPPEVLASLDSSLIKDLPPLNPWSIDVWSFGCILLEMVTGFPLWMSYKGRVVSDTRGTCMVGLFGVQGRETKKIYMKQLALT